MLRSYLAFPLILVVGIAAHAQSGSQSVVGVDAFGPANPVAGGATFEASITLRIKPGYHINAQKPSEDFLVGTSVDVTPPTGISVSKVGYPATRYAKFEFSETPLAVYEGTVKINLRLKVDPSAPGGKVSIPGKVRFQACNDSQCLPPASVTITIPVEVQGTGQQPTTQVPPETPETPDPNEAKQTVTILGVPPNAQVWVDGKHLGRANAQGRLVLRDVSTGRRKVRVENEGFEPWEQNVEVQAARPLTLNISLTESAATNENANTNEAAATTAPPEPPTNAPAESAPPASAAETASNESNVGIYLIGGIILLALGAIGIYAMTRQRSGTKTS